MNGLKQLESWKYSPVHFLPTSDVLSVVPKFIEVKRGEQAKLLTSHHSTEAASTALEINVGDGAALQHSYLFDEGTSSVHVEQVRVNIARNGCYTLNALTVGSKFSRCDFIVRLEGEGAECKLYGLDLGKGASHSDRHLLIEHLAPRTKSVQLFKGIFTDEATASFYGKVKVHRGADGTSAQQVNRNLLLSPNATVNTRPQLEIDTDDVACTHGATVGQLDENAVFFLRSRGLSEHEARSLLTEAFAREVLKAFEPGHEDMERRVKAWLVEEVR